jgi:hypothetical protein
MQPKLLHVGIVVSPTGGIDDSIALFKPLGYAPHFRVRRSEPWIGEMVGIKGADIEIAHLRRAGDPVEIELLAYHSDPSPSCGIQHLAYEMEHVDCEAGDGTVVIEGTKKTLEQLGVATIPEGPNKGTVCAYLRSIDNITIELVEKPKSKTDRTIDSIQETRSVNNKLWMDIVRLVMEVAPERAREIFNQIEENDEKILNLSKWMHE